MSKNMVQEQVVDQYPVRSIQITTCGQLYSQKQKKGLKSDFSGDGLTVNVEYVDSLPSKEGADGVWEEGRDVMVILCLHGSGGSHRAYSNLINVLSQPGVRVIAPNFPTFDLTKSSKVFRHSALEKKEYLKDFMKAIHLTKIDLLVCHSSGIYPASLLWSDSECPPIRSLALVNPSGHRALPSMWPRRIAQPLTDMYQNKVLRSIMKTFAPTILTATGYPMKYGKIDDVVLTAMTMLNSDYPHLTGFLESLRANGVPLLLIFSEKDKVIGSDMFYEMANILGADVDKFSFYNAKGVLEKDGKGTENPWVIVLPEGHCSLINYPQIVNEVVQKFLGSITHSLRSKL